MRVFERIKSDLEQDISSLEGKIKIQDEIIASGIFTTAKQKAAARKDLKKLTKDLRVAQYELRTLIH